MARERWNPNAVLPPGVVEMVTAAARATARTHLYVGLTLWAHPGTLYDFCRRAELPGGDPAHRAMREGRNGWCTMPEEGARAALETARAYVPDGLVAFAVHPDGSRVVL